MGYIHENDPELIHKLEQKLADLIEENMNLRKEIADLSEENRRILLRSQAPHFSTEQATRHAWRIWKNL